MNSQSIQTSQPHSKTETKRRARRSDDQPLTRLCSRCGNRKDIMAYRKNGNVCYKCRSKTVFNKEAAKIDECSKGVRKYPYFVTVMHGNFEEFNFCIVSSKGFNEKDMEGAIKDSVREVFGTCDVTISKASMWEVDKMFDDSDVVTAYTRHAGIIESLITSYLRVAKDRMPKN